MRLTVLTTITFACCASTAHMAHAAEAAYPVRPVRVVVPFAPGGSTDLLSRLMGQRLTQQMGQTFVVDNRGGAGGALGAELVAKAPRDGYTLMATTSGVIVVNPSLYGKLSYDPERDFAPISIMAAVTNMLVVPPSMNVGSVKDLIALAKAKPGALTYASGGNGTSNHLAGELLKHLTGTDFTHVPYKGGGPAVLAVMTGEVSILFAVMPSAIDHVKSGKLKALAVTGRKRSNALPDLPTMIEAGVKDFDVSIWIGLLAPRGVPEAYIQKLNSEVSNAIRAPQIDARLRAMGYEPVGGSTEDMVSTMKRESAMWSQVIKAAGIRAD
jgi:tripartite-type tricarboxylate transporter receptor subunit TctC